MLLKNFLIKELRTTIVDPMKLDQAIEGLHSKYSKRMVSVNLFLISFCYDIFFCIKCDFVKGICIFKKNNTFNSDPGNSTTASVASVHLSAN